MKKEKKIYEEPKMVVIRLEAEGIMQGIGGSDPTPGGEG